MKDPGVRIDNSVHKEGEFSRDPVVQSLIVIVIVTDVFGHRPRGTSCNEVSPIC